MVIGGELDAVYSDVEGRATVFTGGVPGPGFSQKLKWSGAARVRLGYAVDRFLPYVAGGVAFGEINGWNDGAPEDEFSDTYTGWTIGVGTEYAFTDNLIGRVEYRYTDFGNESFESGAVDMDLSTNEVRFGIAYKF